MNVASHAIRSVATVARAVVIACVALTGVAAYSVGALRRLAIRDPVSRAEHRARSRGRLLRWAFTRLGATFVKVGQVASSRPDLFCARVVEELRLLQDHVPPFSYRRVHAIVERELGAPIESRFRAFDRVPVAAGGIAQVHHAVLLDGSEVAVKVLRPGVRARVRRDALLMFWLAHIAHAVSARARAADVIGHVRNLVAGIVAQAELGYEARNYERFRKEFAESRAVAFPIVHADLSTRSLLVMEFVHGVTLDRIRSDHVQQVTRALRGAFFAMCFEHGLVHADLHPGNILIRDDGVVVLLDVGLVKHLPPDVVDQIVDFARCLVIGNAHDLVTHLQAHHRYLTSVDWDAVAADASTFVAELRARAIAEIEVSTVVGKLFELARKHRIRPMPELSLVLLGMVTIEGIAKRLDPAANTMTEIARFLATRISRGRRLARGSRDWSRNETAATQPEEPPEPEPPLPEKPRIALPRTRTRMLEH